MYKEFDWLATYGPFYEVSCVSFARSLTPREALTRLGAGPDDIEQVTFDGLQERTMECIDVANLRSEGDYVGALETAGWTVLVQLWTGSVAFNRLLPSLSRGTKVVSINRNLHAPFQRSFALAKKLTGVAFSQSMLDMRFLAAVIRDE
ncbi:DUF6461 domain-containing protein [Actinomadura sp. ATCC 39365]